MRSEFHVIDFSFMSVCIVTDLDVKSTTRIKQSMSQALTSNYVVTYFCIPTQSQGINSALGKHHRELSTISIDGSELSARMCTGILGRHCQCVI